MSNKLSKHQLEVQYFAKEDSNIKLLTQAYEDAAGYDLFSAETKSILPQSCECISIKIHFAIPKGYYGKIFPRSGLLKNFFVTCDAGVVDSDFEGAVNVMLINHSENIFTVRQGDRIAQMVFMKTKEIKRASQGFGSSGVSVIKKAKFDEEFEISSESAVMSVNDQKIIDQTIKYE